LQQAAKPQGGKESRDGDGARVERGNGVLGAVFQALGKLGLNAPAQAQSSSQTATGQATTSGTTSAASGGGNVKQALHSFLHDLFQAARPANSPANAGSTANATGNASAGKRYGELASKLDELAQQVNSGSDASNKLKSSFDNLVKALDNGSASGKTSTAGNTPDLQSFLHELSRNLQGGALNPVGSLVSTAA
jgi:hypothetical protein